MTINDGIRFIYANQSSDEFGVQLCTSFDSTTRSSGEESRTLVTTKSPYSDIFNFHYASYTEPLVFDLIIYNTDNTWIDANKERTLKKWLLKDDRYWLQIDQDDLADIMYFATVSKAEMLNVGAYCGSMMVTFECDSYHAWSGLRKKTYTTVNGTLSFNFNSNVDFDNYILSPVLIITPTLDGNISIINETTGETLTINNCVTTEVLTIDCATDKPKSSTNQLVIDRWNKNTISFKEGLNKMVLTGNFILELRYRLPIRVCG